MFDFKNPGRYILDGHKPVEEPDLLKWGMWLETADRCVALTDFPGVRISTVFLGLDHNFSISGPPILFETMIFTARDDDPLYGEMDRYSTWEEAEAGHIRMINRVIEAGYVAWPDDLDDGPSDWPDDLGEWHVSGNKA